MSNIAVVTGGAGALGGAVVRELVARGHRVAIFDGPNGKTRADAMVTELGAEKVHVFLGDLSTRAAWNDGLAKARAAFGDAPSFAALVAGGWKGGRALHEETDDTTFQAMMSSNAATVNHALASLLPEMVKARKGSIVAIGSRAVDRPWTSTNASAYAASKAAAVALVQAAAAEVVEYGVRINAILPSTMDTPANRAAMPKVDPKTWVTVESAAKVVAFLLSDDSRDVSGAAIPVYGRA
jgi:NAD(P)-dependent dehydrogenase (short-subunit alcohol dehydrogenase family)